jgi:hypothetical protein
MKLPLGAIFNSLPDRHFRWVESHNLIDSKTGSANTAQKYEETLGQTKLKCRKHYPITAKSRRFYDRGVP